MVSLVAFHSLRPNAIEHRIRHSRNASWQLLQGLLLETDDFKKPKDYKEWISDIAEKGWQCL